MNDRDNQEIRTIRDKSVRNLMKKRTNIFFSIIAVIAILILIFSLSSKENKNIALAESANANQKTTLSQIGYVENQINAIKLQEENLSSKRDIQNINENVIGMQSSFSKWQSQLLNQVESLLTVNNQALSEKLTQLQISLQQLKKQTVPQHYLTIKALPFKVLSIDVWNGQAMATVSIGGYSDLMAKGDSRNGWILIDISFDPAKAIFKNNNNQLVKVNF